MPCSTTAVQEAVNFKVTGSNPVGAVSLSFIMVKKKELTQEELFPYKLFLFRLEHPDGKEKKVCWFQCEEHLEKYITRYNIKKRSKYVKIHKKTK